MVNARCRPLAAAGVAALLALTLMPGTAYADPEEPEYGFQGEQRAANQLDTDSRTRVGPIAGAQARADALGATVLWNAFGTPASLRRTDSGDLAGPAAGSAVEVARGWLAANAALFGLSGAELDALELLDDKPLYDTPDLGRIKAGEAPLNPAVSHIAMFRQTFGGVAAVGGGLVAIGVRPNGAVHYVSSSITPDTGVTNSRSLSPQAAYVKAAADVGRTVGAGDLVQAAAAPAGFTSWTVPGSDDLQRTRPRALPVPGAGVKLVWETVVLDNDADQAQPVAFVHYVDASSGTVLVRENRVHHLADMQAAAEPASGPFSGRTGQLANGGGAGPDHPFDVPAGNGSIVVSVAATPTADLVLDLFYEAVPGVGRTAVATMDGGPNPEAIAYTPPGGVPAGRYIVKVRPFDATGNDVNYNGFLQTVAVGAPDAGARPRWQTFPSHPDLRVGDDGKIKAGRSADDRETWCWDPGTDCDRVVGTRGGPGTNGPQNGPDDEGNNTAARFPWDVSPRTMMSTRTTEGNQADTAPSFGSFLTPDIGAGTSPVSLTRNYSFPFTDQWFDSKCNEASFASPARNDIDASTTNLYVGHNRMHDWSYYLGFTEKNFNLQTSNFDNPSTGGIVPNGGENDPEVGQSQAGAIGGGPTFQGRDNANQIALQDGIPGITNQYLWQPLQAGFYAPCVDGDYDFSVLGHEYGHAIQGRMVGGPDGGLTGAQAGSMNESWSDLNAMEYGNEFGFAGERGENPFAVGAYVTGANDKGIRNYGMNEGENLLNYSDIEYDGNGTTSPHADGEIWSAVNFQIRQRLVGKYNGAFPGSDQALQTRCATGVLPADKCPGNRRWKQMVYDAYLMQQSDTSMVTAKEALLAADVLRFGGENQNELREEFAKRGFGVGVSTAGTADRNPIPSFAEGAGSGDVRVSFTSVPVGEGAPAAANMEVFVGTFEARATPIADTDPDTPVPADATFTPGTYTFIARANGFGAIRFQRTFVPGQDALVQVPMRANLASRTNGAAVTELSDGGPNNRPFLIDDTEESNAAVIDEGDLREQAKRFTVDLAGQDPVTVKEVQVSAALRPGGVNEDPADGETEEDEPNYDTGGQNRFSALRQFEILSCTAAGAVACDQDAQFTSQFVSLPDAFPGARPRPTAPDLTLRPFDVNDFTATHVQLRVLQNQCTGGPLYAGEENPDNSQNPGQDPDCADGLAAGPATAGMTGGISLSQVERVRVAELQVFADPATEIVDGQAPGPVVPEAPATALLLLTAVAVVGGVVTVRRRRSTLV